MTLSMVLPKEYEPVGLGAPFLHKDTWAKNPQREDITNISVGIKMTVCVILQEGGQVTKAAG